MKNKTFLLKNKLNRCAINRMSTKPQ